MITNIIQSGSIIILTVILFLLVLRVNRLSRRLDQNSIAVAQVRETSEEIKAVCGCGHHQCFHDETGCGKIDTWRNYGGPEGYEKPCGCKKYTGPEQLPMVIP